MTLEIKEPDQIKAIELAIDMHRSGMTFPLIVKIMKQILHDENNRPLGVSFLKKQFVAFEYNYKRMEASKTWAKMHSEPPTKVRKALDSRYKRLVHHFLEKWKDDTPEAAAQNDGFPEGWTKLIGGDEKYYTHLY
jgi:hypothetical protein